MKINKKVISTISLFLATIIWGISFVIMKTSLASLTPAYIIALRFSIAAVVLTIIFIKKWKNCSKKLIITGIWTGAFLGAAYIIQTYGLKYTTPGKNAFITSIYCIIVPFLYWIFVKKKPDKFNIIAVILTIIGIGLVSLNFNSETSIINLGDILTIVCSLFYALHIVTVNIYAQKYDIYLITIIGFYSAAIVAWIFSFIFEGIPTKIDINLVPTILFLGLLPSGLAILLQNYGLKYVNPNQGSLILSLESVFGALASIILGFESNLNVIKIIGFIIVFISIIISETKLNFIFKKNKKGLE